ncbi:MAG: type VI secretion system baseplate subunit TssF [Geobacteraceae bacterium]|nr:type VI secretion system baseplate subunit TssF [Geobacteraceae bacterium]
MNRLCISNELFRFKELANEFAEAVPALAPFLGGSGKDPDVERLLDTGAFSNGLLGSRLKSDFPEHVQNLTDLVLPHYLRPFPASTIVGFSPGPGMKGTVTIPSGTPLASTPVDGTTCWFTTTSDLEIHSLEIKDCQVGKGSANAVQIRLPVELKGVSLSEWRPGCLHVFLAGDRASATELYKLLNTGLKRIEIVPCDGGSCVTLPPQSLKALGYQERERLLPYPPHAFPGYRLLQEYFNAPEKFLFFELGGWERWENRGAGRQFTIIIDLEGHADEEQWIGHVAFVPNAVPAVNLFSRNADPVYLNHRDRRYLIRPSGPTPHCHRVFTIDRVTGLSRRTGRQRSYSPLELFGSEVSSEPVYQVSFEKSPSGHGHDAYLRAAFPDGVDFIGGETLSMDLTCTNGTLPESLRVGDIRIPGPGMPPDVAFSNITPVNPGVSLPLGPELLRQLTTHLCLNLVTLGKTEHLHSLLRLYLHHDGKPDSPRAANKKRIEGIRGVKIAQSESMVEGVPVRGSDIRLKVREDHFAGPGDLYLFGCVLNRFFAEYAAINCYTRLTVEGLLRGENCQWSIRRK